MALKSKIVKYAKKQGGRLLRAAKKRYVKKGAPNMKTIMSDVKMLKSLVNVEKKRVDVTSAGPLTFGQTAGAGVTGCQFSSLTPVIPQGATGATRNGNSVKLVSGCLDLYFNQSVNTVNQVKIRYYVYVKPDNGVDMTPANATVALLEPNPFSTVIDFHSSRDPEFFTLYKIIKTGTVTLNQDAIAAGISYSQLKIPLKFSHHLKYNTDGTTTTTKNKFFLTCVADTGDALAFTGAQVSYNMRWYFTDN